LSTVTFIALVASFWFPDFAREADLEEQFKEMEKNSFDSARKDT
jgi:hypothetical protein